MQKDEKPGAFERLRDALADRTEHSARTVRETVEACIALAEEMAPGCPFSPEHTPATICEVCVANDALRSYAARLKEAIGE